jgi:hypothetical protein
MCDVRRYRILFQQNYNVDFRFLFLFLFYFIYSFSHSDNTIQENVRLEVGNAVTWYTVMPHNIYIAQICTRKTKCDFTRSPPREHSNGVNSSDSELNALIISQDLRSQTMYNEQ